MKLLYFRTKRDCIIFFSIISEWKYFDIFRLRKNRIIKCQDRSVSYYTYGLVNIPLKIIIRISLNEKSRFVEMLWRYKKNLNYGKTWNALLGRYFSRNFHVQVLSEKSRQINYEMKEKNLKSSYSSKYTVVKLESNSLRKGWVCKARKLFPSNPMNIFRTEIAWQNSNHSILK